MATSEPRIVKCTFCGSTADVEWVPLELTREELARRSVTNDERVGRHQCKGVPCLKRRHMKEVNP